MTAEGLLGDVVALFVYSLAVYGLAFILGHSKITYPFRRWFVKQGKTGFWLTSLLECPGCLGFWYGGFAVALGCDPLGLQRDAPHALMFALYTSGITFYLALRSGLLDHKEI